jgi:sulfate adenylyltransferase subunit 1
MFTGASTADLVIVLIDARAGVVVQTRRHAQIAALLRIRHVVVAVNKMDLVDFSQERFEQVPSEARELGKALGLPDLQRDPDQCARRRQRRRPLAAHAVVRRPPLLEILETVDVSADRDLERPICGCRSSGWRGRTRMSGASTPGSWPPGRCAPATRSWSPRRA